MQSRRSICILCRRFRPIHSKLTGLRKVSSRARASGDTFNASKLLLDLDAADSPYVRKYEEHHADGKGEMASRFSIRRQKGSPLPNLKMRGRPAFMKNLMRPCAWRPTSADYLNLALIGDPSQEQSTMTLHLREVLRMNMINPMKVDFQRLIDLMIATSQSGYDAGSGAHPSVPEDQKLSIARDEISKCKSITALSRYLALMTDIQSRAEKLSLGSEFVVKGIMNFGLEGKPDISAILKTINAVVQKLESKDLGPGAALCDAGMFFAAKAFNLPALKKYIEIAQTRSYSGTNFRVEVAYEATRRVSNDRERKGLLRLLTGWENNGVPAENEKRKPCLASFEGRTTGGHPYPEVYGSYIRALQMLGATDALWYEWTHPPSWLPEPMLDEIRFGTKRYLRSEIFFDAFLAVGALDRALEVIKNPLWASTPRDDGSSKNLKATAQMTDQGEKMEELKGRIYDAVRRNYARLGGLTGVIENMERRLRKATVGMRIK